jgi:predicted GNAT family acetyltransferase
MTLDQGRTEAQELIQNAQMWAYVVNGQCATICAVTRSTYKVSCVTKVYTTPNFRRMGCAEHLVRHVTRGYAIVCFSWMPDDLPWFE